MQYRKHISLGIMVFVMVPWLAVAEEAGQKEIAIDLNAPDAAQNWCFIGGDWKIKDGILEQQDTRPYGNDYNYGAYAFLKNTVLSDFELTVDFRIDEKGGYRGAGIIFRSIDSCTGYCVSYVSGINQISLSRKHALSSTNNVSITRGVWHTAKVVAKGRQLQGYLDGVLMVQAEDGELNAGAIGFSVNEAGVGYKNIRLKGTKGELKESWKPIPQNHSDPRPLVTYTDAGGYQAFPDIVRLKNGELLCVFFAGYAHVSMPNAEFPKGSRVLGIRSKDNGLTWSEPFVVADTEFDDRDPSICLLPDGRLICDFFTYRGQKNITDVDVRITFSEDNGITWQEPKKIVDGYACSSPIRGLRKGRLIMPVYGGDPTNDQEYQAILRGEKISKTSYGAVIISDDNGKTWGQPIKIDNAGYYLDAETDVIELPDNSLYAVMRGLIYPGSHGAYSISKDGGKTWTPSKDIGFYVPCPYLYMTSKGILLLGQRNRVAVRYSLDNATTWSEPAVYVDLYSGAYPSMTELSDGRIFFVYYGETENYPKPGYKPGKKKPLSVIYGTYFTADKDGIHFLPWPKK